MNIKLALFFLCLSGASLSQETVLDSIATPKAARSVNIEAAAVYPIYLGDNAASQAYQFDLGFNLGVMFHLSHPWYVMAAYQRNSFTVEDQALVGAYEKGAVNRARLLAVYRHSVSNQWQLSGTFGPGYVDFANRSQDEKFHDSGFSLCAGVEIAFTQIDFMDLYIAVDATADFLQTEASPQIEGFFHRAYALQPAFGIRF